MQNFSLKNGIRVVLNEMPYLRSVSIGVWVKTGSIMESKEENGLSHFMEHMAFKGTKNRTARQIAEEMDCVGGQLNASTSKLLTNYYVKVIDEDLPLAVDMLSDIIINPLMDEEEFNKERDVILEEIAMVQDSPEDVVYDAIAYAMFKDQSLGQTILGAHDQIASYTVQDLKNFRNKHYSPKNTVISLAGNVTKEKAEMLLNEKFGAWTGEVGAEYSAQTPNNPTDVILIEKDIEQTHLCLGFKGNALGSDKTYSTAVLNSIFGGGMSSRLFQKIREELGLAYSVYSGPSTYPHCGDFTIYAATNEKNTRKVYDEIMHQIHVLLQEGITEKEFVQAKAQLRSGFVLGLESAYSRMNAMGHNVMLLDRAIEPEETLQKVEKVTLQDVMDVAKEIFGNACSVAIVGRHVQKHKAYFKR